MLLVCQLRRRRPRDCGWKSGTYRNSGTLFAAGLFSRAISQAESGVRESGAGRHSVRSGDMDFMRTGKNHLESLRDGRAVFLDGETITDVTTHPAFRNATASAAHL